MAETNNGADIDVEIAGQKVNVKNIKSLNTIITLLTFSLCGLIAYTLWAHAGDAKEGAKAVAAELRDANKEVAAALKESNKEISGTLKEVARATREQNCLLSLPQEKRERMGETCKRISQ